jgi:hypothetical protein
VEVWRDGEKRDVMGGMRGRGKVMRETEIDDGGRGKEEFWGKEVGKLSAA